ncbi:MAG TPA: DUF2333 family protein [Rhizomicrobium sp.]
MLIACYPALAWWHSTIDDNPDFAAKNVKPAASHAIANAVTLINREVKKHGWSANAPWFSPTALLDDMPNYQKGILSGLTRFSTELRDHIGHNATEPDSNLAGAVEMLRYPPDKWVWPTSDSQYRAAAKNLREYNRQLAAGDVVFDRSAQTLRHVLDSFAADLDASSAVIETHLAKSSGWPFDGLSDDIFYSVKGRLYAEFILLKGLEIDYAAVIAQHGLAKPWASMMESLRAAIALRPWIVLNGAPGGSVFACTLCGQGFYLLRARAQLRQIEDILPP